MKIVSLPPFGFFFVLLSALIIALPATARKTITIDDHTGIYSLGGGYLEYLEDENKQLTLDDVLSGNYSGNFQENEQNVINLGYTHSAYWIRFTVKNNLSEKKTLLLEIAYALLDYVSFYSPNPEGDYTEKKSGQYVLFSKREVKHRNFVFKHTFPPNSIQTIYLKVETEDSFTLPMKLYTQDGFRNEDHKEQMILGIFYGMLIVMLLYNLFIYFFVKEQNYIYLVFFMLSFLIYILSENGPAYEYLWPEFPWWSKRAIPFSVSCVVLTSVLFVRSFLNTKHYTRQLDKVLSIFGILGILGILFSLSIRYYYSIMYAVLLILLYAPVLLATGYACLRKGSRPAIFFLIAWIFPMAGAVLYGLKAFGILPEMFITKYGVPIGAGLQMALFSLGLADKINTMKNNLMDTNKNLVQTKAALIESGQKFRMIAENVSDIIWVMDLATYRINYISPSIRHILGYPPEEAMTLPMEKLLPAPYPDLARKTLKNVRMKDKKEIALLESRSIELEMYHKDGSTFWTEIKTSFLKDNNGKPFGVLGVSRDIDDRKRTEEALKNAKKAAEAANAAKSIFLANMSHEIRTPMNAIIGMGDLMTDTDLKEKQKQYLSIIRSSSRSLLHLIDDILDFTKIEAGKLEFEEIPFSPGDVIEGAADMFLKKMREKNITFLPDIQSDIPDQLMGDPLRLRQVLVNLTDNALKFTETGEITLSVKQQSARPDRVELLFCIKDSGIGISRDDQLRIFDIFTQADGSATRKYGGTGLGLTICKSIVALMKGRIWVESEVGKGSSFFFTAVFKPSTEKTPVKDTVNPAPAKDPEPARETGYFDVLKDMSVLVVEDNPINQMVVMEILNNNGISAKTADNGKAAIDMIRENHFDAVLMDVQMPEIDGIETTRRIRRELNMTELPIIAMTAHAMEGDREKCLEAGMNDYIPKPFDRNQMLEVLRKYMS